MIKRDLLKGIMAIMAAPGLCSTALANADSNVIEADGVRFSWRNASGTMFATLHAPTDGWIAAGFNNRANLRGTRFVISAPSQKPGHAEEHVALVPDHGKVQQLGGTSGLADVQSSFDGIRSHLSFSLPVRMHDPFALDLSPGRSVQLMLAWSRETDFDHHSAWRRHFNIVL